MTGRAFLFLLPLLLFCPAWLAAADYDHTIDKGKISFSWRVDSEKLHIKLRAKTKGWVGIGFNPKDMMKGANILIGRVKKGKASVRDDFGTGTKKHSSDRRKGGWANVSGVSGSEKGGYTEIRFSIPLDSGDEKDTVIHPEGETVVILAFGKSDSYRLGHKSSATLKVNLATGSSH